LSQPRVVVLTDACVLINFALVGRLALLGTLSGLEFKVPEEALAEILGARERESVDGALAEGLLCRTSITEPASLAVFADLRQSLGTGESACLALAEASGAMVASDEKRRFLREAQRRLGPGRILNTPGLFLLAIRRGVITVGEADEAKALLEGHRFRMTFASFRGLL